MPTRILLIGYRGAGKTRVARLVAERLGWSWVDADVEIERAAGKSIAQIFADDGEPAFRDLEEQIVARLCQQEQTVVALGGGAVLRQSSRARVMAAGPVVWLTAPPTVLAQRLGADRTTAARRPGLTPAGTLEEIQQVLAERTPIYRECATLEVDTQEKTPAEVAAELVGWLKDFEQKETKEE